ncbi:hypothetical protein BASA81_011215 [Batrachochytrium salamandrivorans]|nr:hypothetical protein BASA81_011215 [Batrachochytrium salamandrivorans]
MIAATLLVSALAIASTTANKVVVPIRDRQSALTVSASTDITYTLGAPVITNPVTIYSSQKAIVEDFSRGVGASNWWNIEKNYYYQASASSPKVYVDGNVMLGATVTDNYTLGKALSGNDLPNLVQKHISSGALPENADAVYFVLTAKDVTEDIRTDIGPGSFCKDYCGYHVSTTLTSGTRVFYAMAGNPPAACLSGCAPPNNQNSSPNGDVGVDAMLSVLAHELAEAVSDPQSDGTRAWQDASGAENGDKCAYTYGSTSTDSNGASYNVGWNNRNYMIQQNWEPVSQSCSVGIVGSTPDPSPSPTDPSPDPSPSPTDPSPDPSPSPADPSPDPSPSPADPSPDPSPSCDPNNICCQYYGFDC